MVRGASTSPSSARAAPLGLPPITVPEKVHHDRAVLFWQVRGESECAFGSETGYGDEPQPLAAGHSLWVPPGVSHRLHVHADSVLLPLHLRVEAVGGALREPSWIAVDQELRTMLLALVQVQSSIIKPETNLEWRVCAMLQSRTVPATGLPLPETHSARAVAEQLRDNPADERPVSSLAEAQHVSARTLERAFLSETGMTLRDWRSRRRMEMAASLLRSRQSPSLVAGRVGYRSDSTFRRAFKSHYGVTPSEYLRRFGESG